MMSNSKVRKFTIEESAEIDSEAYYTAMEALERAEKKSAAKGYNRAYIAKRTGIDPATITKVLNGTNRNITLKTLFKIMAALERKVFITSENITELHKMKPNFNFEAPKLDVGHYNFTSIVRSSGSNTLPSNSLSFTIRDGRS